SDNQQSTSHMALKIRICSKLKVCRSTSCLNNVKFFRRKGLLDLHVVAVQAQARFAVQTQAWRLTPFSRHPSSPRTLEHAIRHVVGLVLTPYHTHKTVSSHAGHNESA